MSESEAYALYLAAVSSERAAMQAFFAADNTEPFDESFFNHAQRIWEAARYSVDDARTAWYAVAGNEHNPNKICL